MKSYARPLFLLAFVLTEKIRHVSSWRLRLGLGAVLNLDSESVPHPRRVLIPSVCPALQAIADASWITKGRKPSMEGRDCLLKKAKSSLFCCVTYLSFCFLFLLPYRKQSVFLELERHWYNFKKIFIAKFGRNMWHVTSLLIRFNILFSYRL